MSVENRWLTLAVVCMAAILIYLYSLTFAIARDSGQWQNVDSEIRIWYQGLKQPDYPAGSCCGESDSYYCSEHAKDDQVYCIIDDERDNVELKRVPVPVGTVILIPRHKINRDPNLVGRAIVFLSAGGHVYCFVGVSGS